MTNDPELRAAIEHADLGPVSSAEIRELGNQQVVFVELDGAAGHKAEHLSRWLEAITVVQMVAGKFRDADTTLRLHLRGQDADGRPFSVSMPYDETTETAQIHLIHAEITRQQPHQLVARLAALDTTHGEVSNTGGAR